MTRWQHVLVFATLVVATLASMAAASDALDSPAIQEVLIMVEAGIEQSVVLARIEAIGAFPVLDGHDLAELKRGGVSDAVLLRMIELGTPDGLTAPDEEPEEEDELGDDETALIRIYIERPFRITYYEVALDGELVLTRGKLFDGSVGAGRNLKRPVSVGQSERFVAYEGPLAVGTTKASIGFAISMVESDPEDEWGEYAGEHYLTRGIRAIDAELPGQDERGNPGVVCTVKAAQVCEVTASFDRTTPSRLGGFPVYGLRYELRVIDRAFTGE